MTPLTRITLDPDVMGGKPCIRGLRITVGYGSSSQPASHTVTNAAKTSVPRPGFFWQATVAPSA
ncbi:MAG: DUF433 domain-containing protein [Acidobacteria bacterium]|nr:DUF433 domain-containing protein [Acidobacteriota bacterium]